MPTGSEQPAVAPSRILVVDDEAAIRDLLRLALGHEGFTVDSAASGREALETVRSVRPDLIVMDVMLPDHDGFEVVRRLRRDARDVPVVFLSAREGLRDKLEGLELGGDDYVTKPFSVEELVARVRAVLRRTAPESAKAGGAAHHLTFADLDLDEDSHEVWRAGRPVALTATEFKLLRHFLLNPRRVLSKAQLLEQVWGYDFPSDAGVVETYVSYLRKKMDFAELRLLHTVRGAGYVLRLPGPLDGPR